MSENYSSPRQIVCRVDVFFVHTRKIKEEKHNHHDYYYRTHYQHRYTQEETLSSKLIDLRQINVLFAFKFLHVEPVVYLDSVCDIFIESVPYMTPKFIEIWKTFHLVPHYDMLVSGIKPACVRI